MITRQIAASEQGKRLHRYLRNLMPNLPLGQLYKMIDQGKVRVNGKRKKQNYELAAGDELTLLMDEEEFAKASAGGGRAKPKFAGVSAKLDIVFEDGELLVVNKPAGLLTHPDRNEQKNTLITRVHAYLYRKGELDSALFLPATANRLDRNTSGIVLIGKTAGMLHRLNRWIQNRELQKFYVTIVQGRLEGEGTIEGSLVRDERKNRTLVVGEDDEDDFAGERKAAVTRYRALVSAGGCTLVEVELISGRTHQIRSHMQSIGHPLLGDLKYGGRRFGELNHQLLHAWRVILPDGREFHAPPPPRMQRTMEALGLAWPSLGPAGDGWVRFRKRRIGPVPPRHPMDEEVRHMEQQEQQRVVAVRKNADGDIVELKLSSGQVVDYKQAQQMARDGLIAGVNVFRGRDGEPHLRSDPDGRKDNNLDELPTF